MAGEGVGGASLFGYSWEADRAGELVSAPSDDTEVSVGEAVVASAFVLGSSLANASLWEAVEAV